MRIVIAGAGEVGYNIAKDVSDAHEVVVIESDEEKIIDLERLNVETIIGNAANVEILKKAEVKKADIFVAVTGNDEVNLLSGLAAKKLGAEKVIVRVGNPEYVDRPVIKNHPLGYDILLCPQLVLATEIAKLITIPGAVYFASIEDLEVVELQVSENSPIAGKRIAEINIPEGIIIGAIHRGNEIIVPKGEERIFPGDRLAVIGWSGQTGVARRIMGIPVVKNVVIFGGGTVGSYLARMLDKSSLNIKLIDSNERRCEELCSMLRRTKVIYGDATDMDLLIEEEVGKSDVVVAATDSDEKNLLSSLLAKNLGAKKAIARVEKGKYVELFEKVGVDVALSPRKVTYLEVMRQLRLMRVETLGDYEASIAVLEYVASKKLDGKKIREIKFPENTIVGAIKRNGEIIIPRGDTEIKLGDRLYILTSWRNVEKVDKMLS
ncbi:TrkA-N domain protein [Ferroglobus placidus DSM 10642]|uniref:TrkA-N domain protein n=1 Tax=Ferroglobus placidus (strain DSM 10642 / AEDII12DO) TaxID=589924 RepID=D3S164_FERPA|nr:Trk system potassium transporter TrkA [Ferroglobus placidus]ADC64300.1 TrkA-N domain protein [Ferroglobus placidus DSM 10642]